MQGQYSNQWEVVMIVQMAWFFFAILAEGFVFLTIRPRVSTRKSIIPFFIYFSIFSLLKLAGAVLGVVFLHTKALNSSMYAATYSLNSISLGFTTKCVLVFVEHFYKGPRNDKEDEENTKSLNFKIHPFRLVTLILLVAIILSIVGTTQKASGNSSPGLSDAGALMFLVTLIILIVILIHLYYVIEDSRKMFKQLLALAGALLIRAAYSNVVAFGVKDYFGDSKFLLFYGRWEYYTFMVLLTESIISSQLLYAIICFTEWYPNYT